MVERTNQAVAGYRAGKPTLLASGITPSCTSTDTAGGRGKRRRAAFLLAALLLPSLSGCTQQKIVSEHVSGPAAELLRGMQYSLPRGYLNIQAERKNGSITITVAPFYAPDPTARYQLRFNEHSWHDEDYDVTVDGNGLLKTVNYQVKDEAPAIAREIIDITTTALGGPGARESAGGDENPEINKVSVLVDPFQTDPGSWFSVHSAREQISRLGPLVELDAFPLGGTANKTRYGKEGWGATSGFSKPSQCSGSSFCFRLLTPIVVRLRVGDTIEQQIVALPHPEMVAGYNVTFANCVTKISNLTFNNGFLTKVDIHKPSEFKACLQIPSDVVKAVIGLPSAIAKQRIADTDQQKALATAQINLINEQQKLLNLQSQALSGQQAF